MFILLIVPSVFANDWTVKGEQTTLWATIQDGANFYSSNQANITIYFPNTTVAVTNVPMTLVATGRYAYNYTPNTTGIYYTYTQFWNTTSLVATADSTFYVAESYNMMIAIILGLVALIIYFIYTGKDLMKQPTGLEENKGVQKWLNTQTVGLFTYLLASWLILGLFFVLRQFAQNTTVQPFFETLFNIFGLVIPLINIGYMIFFVIFKVVSSLKAGIRHRK